MEDENINEMFEQNPSEKEKGNTNSLNIKFLRKSFN